LTHSKSEDDPIQLDDLLNIIDGIKEAPGRMIVITSNHYDKLDDALTRPGRIDITIKLDYASRKTITEMFRHFYHTPFPSDRINDIRDLSFTPAELIRQYILDKLHSDRFINYVTQNFSN
jgi:ATP-dependent 26S proteasome regulatory subunit